MDPNLDTIGINATVYIVQWYILHIHTVTTLIHISTHVFVDHDSVIRKVERYQRGNQQP